MCHWPFAAFLSHFNCGLAKDSGNPCRNCRVEKFGGEKESGLGSRGGRLINASEVNHLSATALDPDAGHMIAFALHGDARFATGRARNRSGAGGSPRGRLDGMEFLHLLRLRDDRRMEDRALTGGRRRGGSQRYEWFSSNECHCRELRRLWLSIRRRWTLLI